MLEDWLTRKLTVAEAEAANSVRDERLGPDAVPFGFENPTWRQLLADMIPGDELWEFSSPPESWDNLAGRAGIALVREGKVVATILTLLS